MDFLKREAPEHRSANPAVAPYLPHNLPYHLLIRESHAFGQVLAIFFPLSLRHHLSQKHPRGYAVDGAVARTIFHALSVLDTGFVYRSLGSTVAM